MDDTTITALGTASAIDPANDWFAIDRTSLATTQKINRNTILGVSGTPADISTAQVFTNKTLGNTNIFTIRDDRLTLQDNADTTKQAVFQLSGITTGTTRTLTLPNATTTLVGTDVTQTLTGKTLTSPVINGGTISNTTIAVDSIAGFSNSTVVTVGGVQMNNGVIGTADAVVTNSVDDSAITPAKLQAGTGTGWTWQSFTPSWTNLTVGNGNNTGYYIQTGKTVIVQTTIVFGTTSSMGTNPTITLPVTANSNGLSPAVSVIGNTAILDAGTSQFTGRVIYGGTTTALYLVDGTAGTYGVPTTITAAVPHSWATGDILSAQFIYQAA